MDDNKSVDKKLIHISEVEPMGDKDKALMDELYQVLKRHNALDRFGVTLLHEHFKMDDDEVMLEEIDSKKRQNFLQTVKKSVIEKRDDVIETSWRFDI